MEPLACGSSVCSYFWCLDGRILALTWVRKCFCSLVFLKVGLYICFMLLSIASDFGFNIFLILVTGGISCIQKWALGDLYGRMDGMILPLTWV